MATGYEHAFLEPSAQLKEYECPVCLYVTREPYLTDCCGQHFCQVCINRALATRKPCPFCKQHRYSVVLDKKQKRKVLALQVYCVAKEEGCKWTGELGSLETHAREKCHYKVVHCNNGCGETLQSWLLSRHLQELCPKRICRCIYCGYVAAYSEVARHWNTCIKYPVPCPNNCARGTVERGELEQHIHKCPLQLVKCEFGCTDRVRQKDLDTHNEQNVTVHLSAISAFSMRTHEQLRQKEVQMAEMQEKLVKKDAQIELLQRKVETMELCTQTCVVPPLNLTLSNLSYHQRKGLWWDGPKFYSQPKGAKLRMRVCFSHTYEEIAIKLSHIPGDFDSRLQWPVVLTVSIQILNQIAENHHLQNSMNIRLVRPESTELHLGVLRVQYSDMYNCPKGMQYIKDDCLQLKVEVKLS